MRTSFRLNQVFSLILLFVFCVSVTPAVNRFAERMEEDTAVAPQIEGQSKTADCEEDVGFDEGLASIQRTPLKTINSEIFFQYDLRFAYIDVFISKIDEPPEV